MTASHPVQTSGVFLDPKPEIVALLSELPTATTLGERQLALYYLATQWDGRGDIFENGPLLGGATRALAMGMQFNEKRDPDALLQTYDWFSFREDNPLDLMPDAFPRLVEEGLVSAEEVEEAREQGTFLPLFEYLHCEHDYWSLVRPHLGYLPGHRDDVPPEGWDAVFHAPKDREFAVAFIDGCKSWYGTKHWLRELAPRLTPGADVLFQDFGHYTCFWLPSLIGLFRDRFELQAYVDHTYVWRVVKPISAADVEVDFPDEPTCVDRDTYTRIFSGLLREAEARQDRYHVMVLQMQRAAAFAYIGLLDESRAILDSLLTQAEWVPLRPYLKGARVSPTYTPEGRIEL